MPDPKKKKSQKKKKGGRSHMIQVPADGGGSRWVRKDSPWGKRASRAKKAAKLKQSGKAILRSEQNDINKSFHGPVRRKSVSKAISSTPGGRKK